jgi:transposase-like protein
MTLHRNAKLGLAGRLALVQAIEGGMSMKAAAAAFSVSPATAHRWWHCWCEAGEQARSSLGCLLDRSSRPRRSPRELAPELQERICVCRRETGWGPASLTRQSGRCSRGRVSPGQNALRGSLPKAYEWPCPGDLLHVDVSRYARFERPATSSRSARWRKSLHTA